MSREAQAATGVSLPADAALALWRDVERWPTFVEGFARVLERSPEWPGPGAKVVWESGPGGRGRVTEKVVESSADRFVTEVYEDAFQGRQTLRVAEDADGAQVQLTLDYELSRPGPLRAAADALFIRRALRDSLRRTLRRFAVEAEEEAALR